MNMSRSNERSSKGSGFQENTFEQMGVEGTHIKQEIKSGPDSADFQDDSDCEIVDVDSKPEIIHKNARPKFEERVDVALKVVHDTLQPTLETLSKFSNMEVPPSLVKQRDMILSHINSKDKLNLCYPHQSNEEELFDVPNANTNPMEDNSMPEDNLSYEYKLSYSGELDHYEFPRSAPNIKLVENEDDLVIFTTFGTMLDIRIYNSTGKLKYAQAWPFASNEILTCLDTKRTADQIYFSVGSTNGIVYVIEFPSSERLVFK